ncbi:MAG: terminase [Magnetococcales bacterium]|nr:terminase [Magnetococcales bacterium]
MTILRLHPYQRRWLEDRSRFKVGMFARQTGKTFTSCLEIVDDCFAAETRGERARWVILSRGERQAKEAMEEHVKPFCKAYCALYQAVVKREPEFTESEMLIGDVRYTALEARFPGGSRITALPANPDTARGFTANVLLDEFAFHAESRKIWSALFPVISAPNLKMRVVSTPNGKGNKFYDLITLPELPWSRHVVDIHRAVREGLPRDILELRAALGDEDAWRQEFELAWLDEASAWLSFDLINGAEHSEAGDPGRYRGGPCFVGVDIGARRDLFVLWVMELVGDVYWTRRVVAERGLSFANQALLLDEVMRDYRVVRVCMDQTGMGEQPVEEAKRRHGSLRVEGVLFTGPNKLVLANAGKALFEDRRIRIPSGDMALRDDLHKLKKTTSPTGAPRFVATSDEAGHADRTWACFLAAYAASVPVVKIEGAATGVYRPVVDIGLGLDHARHWRDQMDGFQRGFA